MVKTKEGTENRGGGMNSLNEIYYNRILRSYFRFVGAQKEWVFQFHEHWISWPYLTIGSLHSWCRRREISKLDLLYIKDLQENSGRETHTSVFLLQNDGRKMSSSRCVVALNSSTPWTWQVQILLAAFILWCMFLCMRLSLFQLKSIPAGKQNE